MFKEYLFILFFFSFASLSLSQERYEYVGGVKLNDTVIISYRVNFLVNNEDVKGYSITDIGGVHETRSNIFGEYDKTKKELNFRETGIVYTKSTISQNDFCFLNATVKNFVFGKTKNIKTNFIGLFSDNTKCIDGEVLLNAYERMEKRLAKVSDKIKKSKRVPDSLKQKLNLRKMMDSLNMNILRKDEVLSLFTKSDKVIFEIYDGGKEDGDRISVFVNDKEILSNYKANKEKKYFTVDVINDKTSVRIKAMNEGDIAPNTVVVRIKDKSNSIKALSNLKENDETQIDILKTKK